MANEKITSAVGNNWADSALSQSHDAFATLAAIDALILAAPSYESDANVTNARAVIKILKNQLDNIIITIDAGIVASWEKSSRHKSLG